MRRRGRGRASAARCCRPLAHDVEAEELAVALEEDRAAGRRRPRRSRTCRSSRSPGPAAGCRRARRRATSTSRSARSSAASARTCGAGLQRHRPALREVAAGVAARRHLDEAVVARRRPARKARAKSRCDLRLGEVVPAHSARRCADEEAEDLAARWRRPCGRARRAGRGRRRVAASGEAPAAGEAAMRPRRRPWAARRGRRRRTSARRPAASLPPSSATGRRLDEVAGRGRRARRGHEGQEHAAAVQQDRAAVAQDARARSGVVGEVGAVGRGHAGTRARRRAVEREVGVDEGGVVGGRERAAARRRQRSGSAAARMVSARAAASPGGTWRPVTPSATSSAMPPMPEQITGRPAARASWMTSGAFSHQVEGTTTQSTAAHQPDDLARGRRGRGAGPAARRRRAWPAKSARKLGVGPAEAAVQRDRAGRRPRPCQPRRGVEQDQRALVAGDVAEEAEAVAPGAAAPLSPGAAAAPPRSAAAGCAAARSPSRRSGRAGRRSGRRRGRRAASSASRCAWRSAWRAAPCSGKQRRQRVRRGARQRASSPVVSEQAVVGADQLVVVQGHHDAGARAPAGGSPAAISAPMRSMPCRWTTSGRTSVEDAAERRDPAGAVEPGHREAVVGAGLQHEIVAVRAERARRGVGPLQRGRGDEEAGRTPARASSARARSWARISVPPGVQSGWSWATWRILSALMASSVAAKLNDRLRISASAAVVRQPFRTRLPRRHRSGGRRGRAGPPACPTGEDLGGLCREHRGRLAGRRRARTPRRPPRAAGRASAAPASRRPS